MNFTQEEKINLKKNGVASPEKDKNKLNLMSKGEGLKHFLTKALIFWYLRQINHEVYTEAKIKTGKIDLIDMTDKTLIEIETKENLKKYLKNKKKLTNDFDRIHIINAIKLVDFNQIDKLLKKLDL